MYWFEWNLWNMQTSSNEAKGWHDTLEKIRAIDELERGKSTFLSVSRKASETPCSDGSLYELNNTYIEVSAGESQGRRGWITYLTLAIIYFMVCFVGAVMLRNSVWLTGVHHSLGSPASAEDYVLAVLMVLLVGVVTFVILKYVRHFIRLENFVQRRMLIRFNRVTRQVYLHRPEFAGGITVLDWEQVAVDLDVEEEVSNVGEKLTLYWGGKVPVLPHVHLVHVGKRADGTSDIVNLWEFIRRYMEEGPESVPAPKKLLGKVPWPWLSVMTSLSFFRPGWRAGLRWQVVFVVTLASPVLALHSVGHWISLLLCWEPRWPRIIRDAGLPGKPVPPLSTAADWPPLPRVEAVEKKSGHTRQSPKTDAQSAGLEQQTAEQSMPGPVSGIEQDVHHKELK